MLSKDEIDIIEKDTKRKGGSSKELEKFMDIQAKAIEPTIKFYTRLKHLTPKSLFDSIFVSFISATILHFYNRDECFQIIDRVKEELKRLDKVINNG